MVNPFFTGKPVSQAQFLNRHRELRRLVGRLLNHGQSSALVGEPRTGKTSLLRYMMDPGCRDELYGEARKGLVFQFMDAQTLGESFTPAGFWEYVFQPLRETKLLRGGGSLMQAYTECRKNGFGTFELERVLVQLGQSGHHLILLVDEFDALLFHPVLNRSEFFGGLRSLASRCDALALVIASRQSLGALNRQTQELSRTGSPFFNIFEEIPLGPFPGSPSCSAAPAAAFLPPTAASCHESRAASPSSCRRPLRRCGRSMRMGSVVSRRAGSKPGRICISRPHPR
jgi:hypothetical protein